jgi:hypothetical protein
MKFDYSYRRRAIGPWWFHITAWRNRQFGARRSVHFAPGDSRMLVADLTKDRRYILYAMVRPWYGR